MAVPPNQMPPDWQAAAGLVPSGVPPPPPPETWTAPRPTSGKAIASLVCSVGGLALGMLCFVGYPAILAGLVLGVLAIAETGRNGTRSGRGLAIAGTLVSVLAIAAAVTVGAFFFSRMRMGEHEHNAQFQARLDADVQLIVDRLQQYHRANGSLGPGGPVLAKAPVSNGVEPTDTRDGRVRGVLQVRHLLDRHEITCGYDSSAFELTVMGDSTARLVMHDWQRRKILDIEITDAGAGQWRARAP
ncbi:MAG: DUF4190 domain-containing protein [Planctomycetes bacterium]|nr:DUF4190 domain-containing protein [Planctomycetota bacterium]MCL4731379.1 hypothetical protein [Planctomycetota bacterium]